MANSQLLIQLSDLHKRVESLLTDRNSLLAKIKELNDKIIVLEEQHRLDREELVKANQEIEFLTLSHRLADSPDTIIEARRKLAGLIRTINNCIRMINEEI